MTVSVACKDVGANCSWSAKAETEEELLKKVAQHAKESHGMTSVDPAMLAKVKGAIKHT
jgi:predicted small metal-binding protein